MKDILTITGAGIILFMLLRGDYTPAPASAQICPNFTIVKPLSITEYEQNPCDVEGTYCPEYHEEITYLLINGSNFTSELSYPDGYTGCL